MTKVVRYLFALVIAMIVAANVAAQEGLPAGAVVLDDNLGMHSGPYPRISPNGQWVAYVSQGYVCVCSVKDHKPLKIMEVPNSWTWPHLRVSDNHTPSTGRFDQIMHGLEREEYNKLLEQVYREIYGPNWTYDSRGFVFGIVQYVADRKSWIKDTYLANVDGTLTPLAHVDPDTLTPGGVAGILTRDRKYLVTSYIGPLLWDVNRNKPRATPFVNLIPSHTSDRWLGIEKDSNQLVITDSNFEVIRRFDEYGGESSGGPTSWSPDERFVIWRNQIGYDHFSNWEGFRLDLQTSEKRLMDGRFMDEKINFTGHGGEFYRCGNIAKEHVEGDTVIGAHLTLIPDGDGQEVELWRIESDNESAAMGPLYTWGGLTPIQTSTGRGLFVLSLRKWVDQKDYSYFELIDRAGNRWHLRDENGEQLLAPYIIVGFADENRLLVAYDDKRMFTFPVAIVKTADNKVN